MLKSDQEIRALLRDYATSLFPLVLVYLLEVVRRSDEDAVLLCSVTSEMTSKTEVRSTNFVASGTAFTTDCFVALALINGNYVSVFPLLMYLMRGPCRDNEAMK